MVRQASSAREHSLIFRNEVLIVENNVEEVNCGLAASPASVYSPKKRTVAMASKEMGTHIPPSSAHCSVI